MKRILDPSFRYTPSYETDLRKTFERVRRERESQLLQAASKKLEDANVVLLDSRKAG